MIQRLVRKGSCNIERELTILGTSAPDRRAGPATRKRAPWKREKGESASLVRVVVGFLGTSRLASWIFGKWLEPSGRNVSGLHR